MKSFLLSKVIAKNIIEEFLNINVLISPVFSSPRRVEAAGGAALRPSAGDAGGWRRPGRGDLSMLPGSSQHRATWWCGSQAPDALGDPAMWPGYVWQPRA